MPRDAAGLAELMGFYCERAAAFCSDVGYQDGGYFDELVRMFEQGLRPSPSYLLGDRNRLIALLNRVRVISHNFGYGVGDLMDTMLVGANE